ncbi:hypothetical protein [Paraburkholderia xenovorans]|uniref:hypothetical protein n=1 Tax=Paraburkholderia xenovorans TaxID=36873 RepID=UPI0038B8E5C9
MKVGIARIEEAAAGIRVLELAPLDGKPLPPYTAGAHISAHLPAGLVRQYSLCGRPEQDDAYVIAVQHADGSRGGSRAMHALRVGDSVHVEGPRNDFPLARDARHSVLLAGGIGITPLLCMAERLARGGGSFELHYCVRERERAAFLDRLAEPLLKDRCTLHVDDAPADARLDFERVMRRYGPGWHLYVCGPAGFMEHALSTAKQAGWPDRELHREYFGAPVADTTSDGAFSVRLARTMALQRQALIDVVKRVGPCVLLGFSQGGGFVFDAADAARDLVRACIALEPHGVPASFDAGLPGTPALVVFGDFIEEDEAWRAHSARANASMAAWTTAGGRGERIDLPALGMRGNTHMMMMDTNSDDVFRIVLDWLDGCAGMRVPS